MSKNKREAGDLELVKCPLCEEQMDIIDFRKLLVRKEIEVPLEVVFSTACKEQSMGVKVNLSVKFVDEELQILSPFLLHSARFGLLDSVACQD